MKNAFAIAALVAVALGLAIGQWQIAEAQFGDSVASLIDVVNGVLTGHPPWPNYQNRVLGPAVFALVRQTTHGSDAGAFQLTVVLLLWVFFCIHGVCAWALTRSVHRTALVVLAAFALNALLMQTPWLYLWDLIDLSVFSLLVWALLAGCSPWVILVIVAAETFNREVALIFALAFLCEGAIVWRKTGNWTRMLTGLALCAGVFAVVLLIRRTLLVEAVMPLSTVARAGQQGLGGSFLLNLTELAHLATDRKNLLWQLPHWLLVLAITARLGWDLVIPAHRRTALWLGAVFLAVWAVGYVVEWRIWLNFVPYLTLSLGVADASRTADLAATGRGPSLSTERFGG